MPRSDDAYDLVHTYSQAKAGKSKTERPAVRHLGRDGAGVRRIIGEAVAQPPTPPTGVVYLFVDSGDDRLKQIDSTGTVVDLAQAGAPADLSYVTVNSEGDLSAERSLAVTNELSLTDNGADSSVQLGVQAGNIDAATLSGASGTNGQVLVTDGTDASWSAGAQNLPDWQEAANSPLDMAGSGSATLSFQSSREMVLILPETGTGTANVVFDMRVNGDAGNNYDQSDADGSTQSANSEWTGVNHSFYGRMPIWVSGVATQSAISVASFAENHNDSSALLRGINETGVSPPVDSITMIDQGGGPSQFEWRVFYL